MCHPEKLRTSADYISFCLDCQKSTAVPVTQPGADLYPASRPLKCIHPTSSAYYPASPHGLSVQASQPFLYACCQIGRHSAIRAIL